MSVAARVAVVPGDDAAPEAVSATLAVLKVLDPPVEWLVLPDGATLAAKMTPAEGERMIRATLDACDTALFGATSGATPGIWHLRWGKGTYANVRPLRWRRGVPSPIRGPDGIDYVIVRENTEDLYVGLEGELQELLASRLGLRPFGGLLDVEIRHDPRQASEGRYAIKLITRENTERVARFACRLALDRKARGYPGKVTCAAKWNVLRRSDGFFRQVVQRVVSDYPDLVYEEFLVDDFARRLVAEPQSVDVVVLPNLYGDVLSDEGAATIGGLGLAPSGCYGDDYAYFEPVHGTAPDIAGRGVINPAATILSAAMLLEHVGLADAGRRLETAVDRALAAGESLTPDLGGSATTDEFADAVLQQL